MVAAEGGRRARHARLLDFEIDKNENTQGCSLASCIFVVGQYLRELLSCGDLERAAGRDGE